ncbi:GFA family protein [Mesorhizobium sp. M0902]|uniref:GFA family protein n=1 Tax=unclassified Mesorhizobium TaxID=325217 RepID=UPI003338672E
MAGPDNENNQNASNRTLTGKCLCGAVQYAVADAFVYAANCHCSNCRRTTGSAFKPFAGIERDRLSLTNGEDNLTIFGDETGHDAHCKTCGSLLYSVVRDGAFVHVAMGTLVDEPTIRPTQHIFVGSKAKWFTITDDLPQYEEHVVAADAGE